MFKNYTVLKTESKRCPYISPRSSLSPQKQVMIVIGFLNILSETLYENTSKYELHS